MGTVTLGPTDLHNDYKKSINTNNFTFKGFDKLRIRQNKLQI